MRPGNILGRAKFAARRALFRWRMKRKLGAQIKELRGRIKLARLERDAPKLMPQTFGPMKKELSGEKTKLRNALKRKKRQMRRIETRSMAGAGKR